MACFLVPATEAVVVTAVTQVVKSRENAHKVERIKIDSEKANYSAAKEGKMPFSRKLKWLTNMLWGGTFLLAFEHVWHGEVVPWFPFLTAAENSADTAAMLHEMSTIGVTMAVIVTAVWGGMLIITNALEKKELEAQSATN